MAENAIINDFGAGEISQKFEGRVNLPDYRRAARQLQNFIPMTSGGITKRPGTVYVATGKTQGEKVRLVPFEFSDTQAYVLEFGDQYIRVYKDGAQIEDGGSPVEVVSPYLEAELFELQFEQSADTLYITHTNHEPATLTRSDHVTWTLADETITVGGGSNIDFADDDEHPACLTFMDERLLYGGPNVQPQTIFGSMTGDWDNFTQGSSAEDSFEYTFASRKVHRIRWMVGDDQLLFGTMNGEWRATDLSPDSLPIIRKQSNYGSKKLQALALSSGVLFVSKNGKRVRYMAFEETTQKFRSPDLTKLAEHITRATGGIVDWDYQEDPDSTLWAVRGDGVLLSFTFDPDFGVSAWARHVTDGVVESVAVIAGSDEDEVWISVKRTIGGTDYRYIEYFKPRDWGSDQKDYFYVDSGLSYDGKDAETITEITKSATCTITFAATTSFANDDLIRISGVTDMPEVNGQTYMLKNKATNTFDLYTADGGDQIDSSGFSAAADDGSAEEVVITVSGLDHLEAETVDLCIDGSDKGSATVSSGAVTLPKYGNTIHVGLNYVSKLQTMKYGIPITKRIHHLTLRLYRALGGQFGPTEDNLDRFDYFQLGDAMDTAPQLVGNPDDDDSPDSDKEVAFDGPYEKSGSIVIYHDDPLPFSLLMIMAEMGVYQK